MGRSNCRSAVLVVRARDQEPACRTFSDRLPASGGRHGRRVREFEAPANGDRRSRRGWPSRSGLRAAGRGEQGPYPIRHRLAYNGKLLGEVTRAFLKTVAAFYEERLGASAREAKSSHNRAKRRTCGVRVEHAARGPQGSASGSPPARASTNRACFAFALAARCRTRSP